MGWLANLLAIVVKISVSRANLWLGVVSAPRSPHRKFIWNSVLNSSIKVGSNVGPNDDISWMTVRALRLNMSTWLAKWRAASKCAAVALKSKSRLFTRLVGNASSGCIRPPPSPSSNKQMKTGELKKSFVAVVDTVFQVSRCYRFE